MKENKRPLPEYVRKVVDDPARLDALSALGVMDSEPDGDFERLCRTVARIFRADIALISLVDQERQWFSACMGVGALMESRTDTSFCAYALAEDSNSMVVLDALADDRFKDNPLVAGAPGIRFYAGSPIIVAGQKVGSVCVMGLTPRDRVDPDDLLQLEDLAGVASTMFSLKDEARVRARTAAALVREEWRHALTLEAGKVGSWVWDIQSGEVVCNDTLRAMCSLPDVGTITTEHILAATHPSDAQAVHSGLRASIVEGVDFNSEARVAASGRWLTIRGRVYQRDTDGRALVMMGVCIDVSESKQSAEHTRLLLRELNHRVKNTLAMIQSVARQTIRQNPDPNDFIEAFSGRLRTISEAHVLLADRDWSGVPLHDVVASQLGPNFMVNPDRVEVRGDDMMLPADHALGLGLILHELTTNAHRHGAWSDATGVVSIEWDVAAKPVRGLKLKWREHGGPAVEHPQEYGLGAKLIERSLAKVLDSRVELNFLPDGVEADVWLPLPQAEH
ncbi:hypothetical protein WH87_13945 [Devosia epidermidihirudinis]|uniref:histidine kinase n=1 Tax=Devosia epidermidihirudinis TaxID=1293439 RepID=A0A0F5Q973_9HYPH|nr:HWE histidine kinase domain-containing protein [Devosia epidermidihirudinis]KKC36559.1 hypothetical protein WH87_13945 [Devosia epidermidihirudinis]